MANAQDGAEEGRRRRGDRRQAGFGDDIERAFCASHLAVPATGFPVQHRTDVATLRPVVVDRRPGAILLCDGAHPGDHFWPTGDAVDRNGPAED